MPYRWTGTAARTRRVILSDAELGSIVKSVGDTSTNIGIAPIVATAIAVAGALIIGLVEETSALAISTTYRQGVSFVVLVLVLLLRPQGLLGVARIRR